MSKRLRTIGLHILSFTVLYVILAIGHACHAKLMYCLHYLKLKLKEGCPTFKEQLKSFVQAKFLLYCRL